ncbi:MAG TPA: hypothetical protein VEB39_03275 [Sphingomicrobium sp.]|nr:hypothetical protein [Sphingomicrobium sp.]
MGPPVSAKDNTAEQPAQKTPEQLIDDEIQARVLRLPLRCKNWPCPEVEALRSPAYRRCEAQVNELKSNQQISGMDLADAQLNALAICDGEETARQRRAMTIEFDTLLAAQTADARRRLLTDQRLWEIGLKTCNTPGAGQAGAMMAASCEQQAIIERRIDLRRRLRSFFR